MSRRSWLSADRRRVIERLFPPLFLFGLPFLYFWRASIGRTLLAEGDAFSYFFPRELLVSHLIGAGHLPLWNPYLFSGFPLLAAMQTAVLYPGSWLFLVLPPVSAMNLQVITTYAMAALCTYGYCRTVGCTRFAATFSGVTFGFSGFLLARVGQVSIIEGAACFPLLVLCLEQLRRRGQFRFVALGAVAVALTIFSGHPQIPAYVLMTAVLYVGFFLLGEAPPVGRARYAALAAATLACGMLLSAVQLLPTAELASHSVRARLSYEEFVSFSLPVSQLPMLLFPYFFGGQPGSVYWGAWGGMWEITGYVGVIPPMLAIATLSRSRMNGVIRFWVFLAGLSLLLALGGGLPTARIAYHIPIYSSFRCPGRNLLECDLALAVLSGLALTSLFAGAAVPVRRGAILVLLAAASVATLAAAAGASIWGPLARVHAAWSGVTGAGLRQALSLRNPMIFLPVLLAGAGAAVLIAAGRRPRRSTKALLLMVHCVDLFAFGALLPVHFPAAAQVTEPSRYATFLRSTSANPTRDRLAFATAGGAAPVGSLTTWQEPMINGYDPLLLSRYSRFTGGMTYFGVIPEPALVNFSGFLNLLNVRYLVLTIPERSTRGPRLDGMFFAPWDLDGHLSHGDAMEFPLSSAVKTTRIGVVTSLSDAVTIDQGTPVARVTLWGADGTREERILRAGIDTAEWAWDRPDVRATVRHRRARVAESFSADGCVGHTYAGGLDYGRRLDAVRVRIEYIARIGLLNLSRLTLYDPATNRSRPVTPLDQLLNDPARWVRRFEDGGTVVLENRDALPRVWPARRVLRLAPAEILQAVRGGKLPDGTPFDPRDTALVEGQVPDSRDAPDPDAKVRIVAYQPNAVELQSRSAGGAFLVLSEIFYPGWHAEIDGREAHIVRTDYVLRGIHVPAGIHQVRFVYRPASVLAGAGISAATALTLLGIAGYGRRRWASVGPPRHAALTASS